MLVGNLTDINVTGIEARKHDSHLGDAHEHFVIGILIRWGFDVGKVDISGAPYDLFIYAYQSPNGERRFLRAQVKTIGDDGSLPLGGGGRGGVDREYTSDVKIYKYTEEHNDVIIGVDRNTLDLYIVPTRFACGWGMSKTKNKLTLLRNNWDVFRNWNDAFLNSLGSQLPP